jgi:hypothetical protein
MGKHGASIFMVAEKQFAGKLVVLRKERAG